jgi:multidrug resistance efflux pump
MRKLLLYAVSVGTILGVAALLLLLGHSLRGKGERGGPPSSAEGGTVHGGPVAVRAVHPRQDESLTLSVQQITNVEPLFQAELRAQVAGVVRRVPRSIGDKVSHDEVLVDIDVPDLEAELAQKEAVIRQRERDVFLADAQAKSAEALMQVAQRNVPIRRAERDMTVEMREFHWVRLNRFTEAGGKGGVNQNLVDEERRDYNASVYAVEAAQAAIDKAKDDVKEKETAWKAALAEVELKKSLAEVARKDRAWTRTKLGFARIAAPFDGVITDRTVHPGMLVQNASTGRADALLTVDRTDIVTLVMKVPDNFAPYVTQGTDAVIRIDQYPGATIKGKVTRVTPSILNRDRTLRVEVDLYNGSEADYKQFAARCVATWLPPLLSTNPLERVLLEQAANDVWSKDCRSVLDPFPLRPQVSGASGREVHLKPGMSGYMRLNLQQFRNVALIPANAVYTVGGNQYVLAVEDIGKTEKDVGVTRQLPVRVQVNDGKVAKVAVIVRPADPLRGQTEETRELRPEETFILSRQLEIGDGQRVKVSVEDWTSSK